MILGDQWPGRSHTGAPKEGLSTIGPASFGLVIQSIKKRWPLGMVVRRGDLLHLAFIHTEQYRFGGGGGLDEANKYPPYALGYAHGWPPKLVESALACRKQVGKRKPQTCRGRCLSARSRATRQCHGQSPTCSHDCRIVEKGSIGRNNCATIWRPDGEKCPILVRSMRSSRALGRCAPTMCSRLNYRKSQRSRASRRIAPSSANLGDKFGTQIA